jgi:PAS domain S-box-containing protein
MAHPGADYNAMPTSIRALPARPAVSRPKFITFAVLASLLLAVLALLGYLTISQLLAALNETDHGIRVRAQLRLVRIAVGDMESSQRGYLITGEPRYLEPFKLTSGRIDADIAELGKLTAGDVAQQHALARLRDLVAAKRVELKNTIDTFDARGYTAARALVLADTGKRLMDEIRMVIDDIEAEEGRRLTDRRAEETSTLQRTVMLSVLFCGLLAVLLAAIYYLLGREMSMHAAYEESLAATNADLETRIRERTRSLEESQARLNGVVTGAPDAIITIDGTETVVLANPAAGDMFGYTAQQMVGLPLNQLIPERYRPDHGAHIQRFAASAVVTRRMSAMRVVYALRSDDTEFPVDASISQITIGGKKLYTVILRDISEEMRAKNNLEQSRKELRELTAALEYVQEEERKRIAQELHDDLGQQLTVLKMDASLIRSKLAPEQRDVLRIAERLEGVLTRTVQSVRRISADLRPAMLDDLGLVPALEELVQHISQHSGLECRLAASEDLRVVDRLATPLFRVAQESLNNAVKHAQASRITVSLFEEDSRLVMRIEDDGKGITQDDRRKRKSYGLIGMRERVYALGGEFEVRSRERAGTTVEVRVPQSA